MKYRRWDEEFIMDHAEEIANIDDVLLPGGLRGYIEHTKFKDVMRLNQLDLILDSYMDDLAREGKLSLEEAGIEAKKEINDFLEKHPELHGVFKYVDRETWIKEMWGSEENYHKHLAGNLTLEDYKKMAEEMENAGSE